VGGIGCESEENADGAESCTKTSGEAEGGGVWTGSSTTRRDVSRVKHALADYGLDSDSNSNSPGATVEVSLTLTGTVRVRYV
jgi:hypothetical protein